MQSSPLRSLLAETARRYPERSALVFADRALSYRELEAAADRLAGRLAALDWHLRGRRIALIAPNAPVLPLALFATARLGAVSVPLSARLRESELREIVHDARPALVLSVGSHAGFSFTELGRELAREVPTRWLTVSAEGELVDDVGAPGEGFEPPAPDVAAVMYTSGTTGHPKGALVTDSSELSAAGALASALRLTTGDTTLLVVPIAHRFGYSCLLATVASGGTAVLLEPGASPEPILRELERGRANILHGSPSLLASVVRSRPSALLGVRGGFVAGSRCPPELLERLDGIGSRTLNVYGLTETGAVSACRHDDDPATRHATVGRPLPGVEVRVAGGAGEGELQVRGPARGYDRQPELDAESFVDGWFKTGDVASIADDGSISISGRIKEIVHVGGFNVHPAEIEAVLVTHPDVERAVVVGVPHDSLDDRLEAYVVARPGADPSPADLLRFMRGRIAGYKLPYTIHLVDETPLLATGKPDRLALAAMSERRRRAAV